MQVLSGFVFCLVILCTAPSLASPSLLPEGGKDAIHTHVWNKFTDVSRRHQTLSAERDQAQALCDQGSDLHCGLVRFDTAVESLRGYRGLELLRRVDARFNRLTYRLDEHLYGEEEYWATPAEFMARGAGDCEDFALAKYHALKELDWPEEDMRVVVLWDERARLHHAVLLVNHQGKEWLLDDMNRELIPSSRISHYLPLYSINSHESYYYHELYATR